MLLLNDTRTDVIRLNDQIKLLVMMQKKTHSQQQDVAKELNETTKAIKHIKKNVVFTEVEELIANDK